MSRALVTGAAAGLGGGHRRRLWHATDLRPRRASPIASTPPDATLAAIEAAGADARAAPRRFSRRSRRGRRDRSTRWSRATGRSIRWCTRRAARRQAIRAPRRSRTTARCSTATCAARSSPPHAVLPAMREARFGRIVFFGMTGSSETRPFRGFSLHQAAKSAVVAFARALAVEEARHGITVNVDRPGDIREKTLDARGRARARRAAIRAAARAVTRTLPMSCAFSSRPSAISSPGPSSP